MSRPQTVQGIRKSGTDTGADSPLDPSDLRTHPPSFPSLSLITHTWSAPSAPI